jgi:hypothetical protein
MSGHVAIVPEVPTPCPTVYITAPSDKALPRPLGSFSNKGHITYQHFVTLHLLETIKGACRDHFRGHKTDEQITLLDLARAPAESHTHTSTHTLRLGSSSLSHPLVTPTTSTSVQDNIELTSPIRHRAFLGPNQYKSPVFFLHTIRIPDT